MIESTVIRGSSELKRILQHDLCLAPERSADRRGGPGAMGAPRNRTSPAVARSSPSRIRTSVDLPDPDSPTMPTLPPGSIARSTPRSARRSPRGPNSDVRGSRNVR